MVSSVQSSLSTLGFEMARDMSAQKQEQGQVQDDKNMASDIQAQIKEQIVATNSVEATADAIKTEDEMVGSLLNIQA